MEISRRNLFGLGVGAVVAASPAARALMGAVPAEVYPAATSGLYAWGVGSITAISAEQEFTNRMLAPMIGHVIRLHEKSITLGMSAVRITDDDGVKFLPIEDLYYGD